MQNNIQVKSKIKKADAHLQRGDINGAKDIYTELYRKYPENKDIALTLALIHRRLGNYTDTVSISEKIIKSNKNLAIGYHILGSGMQCIGDIEGAIEKYKKAIQLDAKYYETHYFLGNAYRQINNSESAIHSYESAIKLYPDFVEALCNLGALYTEQRRLDEARAVLLKANSIQPDTIQVLCNLSELLLIENRLGEALEISLKSISIDPYYINAIRISANIYMQMGQYNKALENYKKCISIEHDDVSIGAICQIYERRGEYTKARDLLASEITKTIPGTNTILAYSAISRHFKTEPIAIGLLKRSAVNNNYDIASKINFHSELGKHFDKNREYTEAFYHYQKSNELERNLYNDSIYSNFLTVDIIKKWDTTYSHSSNNRFEYKPIDTTPVFIVGLPRSGTTLIEQILASHNSVCGAGELSEISNISQELIKYDYQKHGPAIFDELDQQWIDKNRERYTNKLHTASNCAYKVVTDKMPTNFWHIGLIRLLLPEARIIHVSRNILDTCLSIYFQRFGNTMRFTTDLAEIGKYVLSYQQLMGYWEKYTDNTILNINYEDIVSDLNSNTKRLLDFCELGWDENCLQFYNNNRDVNTPSYDQVREPIYKRSVNRWKNYRKQLQPLIEYLNINSVTDQKDHG